VGSNKRSSTRHSAGKTQALDEFGTNLTQLAAEGKLDPVVGRQQEIERAIQILGRRTKNNPVLIGEPGVGKTAIAEGLAQRIVNKKRPRPSGRQAGDQPGYGLASGRPDSVANLKSASRRLWMRSALPETSS